MKFNTKPKINDSKNQIKLLEKNKQLIRTLELKSKLKDVIDLKKSQLINLTSINTLNNELAPLEKVAFTSNDPLKRIASDMLIEDKLNKYSEMLKTNINKITEPNFDNMDLKTANKAYTQINNLISHFYNYSSYLDTKYKSMHYHRYKTSQQNLEYDLTQSINKLHIFAAKYLSYYIQKKYSTLNHNNYIHAKNDIKQFNTYKNDLLTKRPINKSDKDYLNNTSHKLHTFIKSAEKEFNEHILEIEVDKAEYLIANSSSFKKDARTFDDFKRTLTSCKRNIEKLDKNKKYKERLKQIDSKLKSKNVMKTLLNKVKPKKVKPKSIHSNACSKELEFLNNNNVEFNFVYEKEKNFYNLREKEQNIINSISGGDLTKGSCASLSLAYIGQTHNLNVTDFRGGASQKYFSKLKNLRTICGFVDQKYIKNFSSFDLAKDADKIKSQVEPDKKYLFIYAHHAAIIKKEGDTLFYLELQSPIKKNNGWTSFTSNNQTIESTLKDRFGALSSSSYPKPSKPPKPPILVDIDGFGKPQAKADLRTILGYLNNPYKFRQYKGNNGSIK